jgi:hypothetical protein
VYSSAPLNTAKEASTSRGAFDRAEAIKTHQIMINPMSPTIPSWTPTSTTSLWPTKAVPSFSFSNRGIDLRPVPINQRTGDASRQLSTAVA